MCRKSDAYKIRGTLWGAKQAFGWKGCGKPRTVSLNIQHLRTEYADSRKWSRLATYSVVTSGIATCSLACTVVKPTLTNARKELQKNKYNYHTKNSRDWKVTNGCYTSAIYIYESNIRFNIIIRSTDRSRRDIIWTTDNVVL